MSQAGSGGHRSWRRTSEAGPRSTPLMEGYAARGTVAAGHPGGRIVALALLMFAYYRDSFSPAENWVATV